MVTVVHVDHNPMGDAVPPEVFTGELSDIVRHLIQGTSQGCTPVGATYSDLMVDLLDGGVHWEGNSLFLVHPTHCAK